MEDDTDWNPEKIDEAMHAGKKNGMHSTKSVLYRLFYPWQDTDGILHFYDIIYNRDEV
jgi:murein L,D-transpeptidase YcbB/YkuD